jgi:hypothetical protein
MTGQEVRTKALVGGQDAELKERQQMDLKRSPRNLEGEQVVRGGG